jgi:hypothetical protein
MNKEKDLVCRITFAIECYTGKNDIEPEDVWYSTLDVRNAIFEAVDYLYDKQYARVEVKHFLKEQTQAIIYR